MPDETDCYSLVPPELKAIPNWVTWKLIQQNGKKPTKVPYTAAGTAADSTNPDTWDNFSAVCSFRPTNMGGIGFVFTPACGYVGLDLDNALDENGELKEKFSKIVNTLSTYTEISPSGTGLHLILRCKDHPYETGKHLNDIGIFYTSRYFTITGKQWGTTNTIEYYDVKTIREVCDPFVKKEIKRVIPSTTLPDMLDDDIINIASNASNGAKFNSLMSGNITGYPSASEADAALASILAFYTTDSGQIERIMRNSRLFREKWDKNVTYLSRTISNAISITTNHFSLNQLQGDPKEGKEITDALLSTEYLTDKQIQKILDDNKLPLFPEINAGLITEYMNFAGKMTYSIREFHFAAMLSMLSMAFGRRVVVRVGMSKIYCNVFALVVGHTTISGKSVACNMAVDNFSNVVMYEEEMAKTNSVKLIRGTISEAAVIQQLNDTYNYLWHFDDCGGFFNDALSWNAHILGTLCSLYDCTEIERTLSKRGKDKEQHRWYCPTPFVSLLWNTTISTLEEVCGDRLFNSGFFPRIMWFIGENGRVRENIDFTAEDDAVLMKLQSQVREIREKFYGVPYEGIVFGVNVLIEKWKMKNDLKYTNKEDEMYRAAAGRAFIHIYKIATILSLLDREIQSQVLNCVSYPITLKIPDKYAQLAIKIVEEYLLPRSIHVSKMSISNDMSNHHVKILKALDYHGGVATRSQLINHTKLNTSELGKALDSMLIGESIETYKCKSKGAKKDTEYYIKKNRE